MTEAIFRLTHYVYRDQIYVNPNIHTGHIGQAGCELADQNLRVIADLIDRASAANPALSPLEQPILARSLIGYFALSDRRKSDWEKAKRWFNKLLWEADFLSNPQKMDLKLSEYLDSSRQLNKVNEVTGYLNLAHSRVSSLIMGKSRYQLGSRAWSTLVYAEDYALRRAVREGKFFYGAVRLDAT